MLFLNFLFIKVPTKKKSVFNSSNKNKYLFEQQIRILEWFLKDHVTLKTNDAENSQK